jgi:hypothetical protein
MVFHIVIFKVGGGTALAPSQFKALNLSGLSIRLSECNISTKAEQMLLKYIGEFYENQWANSRRS